MTSRPIRWSLWVLLLAAVAVAIALAGRYGTGYAVLVLPPWRVELSAMLLALLILLGFVGFYFLIGFVRGALRFPRALRARKRERLANKSRDALYAAMRSLFAGQFRDAEEHARAAMSAETVHVGTRDLAAAVAAWAAHESGHSEAAVPYLDRIRGARSNEMRDASRAYMLLAEGRAKDALTLLKELSKSAPKNPGVLKMRVEAEMAENAWDDVLASLGPLTKSGLMPEAAAQQIRLHAEKKMLKSRPADGEVILATWQSLSSESRRDAGLVATAASRLIDAGRGNDAAKLVEEALVARGGSGWDSALAAIYTDCKTDNTLEQIQQAESWLRQHPRDAVLLAALGKLCMRESLWGKAQSYLEASLALSPSADAHMTLARLMEEIGRPEEAIRHIRRSAELVL